MADQNFRVKRGLEVGIGGTVLIAKSDGNIGIGSAIPTTKLDVDGTVTATSFAGDGSNLTGVSATNTDLSGDTTPQLGGDLDLNSNDITGTGNVNITGVITATSFDGNLATTDLTGTITNAQLAGSIANGKLANSSVSFGGVSVSLGAADATPAFDLQDATGYPTSSLTGTITNAQLAGSIADDKLASTFLKNVVEDTSPQLGGTLDTNGNRIQFGDSDTDADDRLQFGAGSDLEIYHDGSNSFIHDGGTGGLYIRAANTLGFRDVANSNANWANFNSGGSVDLYHDGNERLKTTTTGVKILNGTTATIAGPDEIIIDPATVGDNTGVVRIKGDLFVDGTTTQINSTTLELADFVVGVATTATTDLLTDGAGIGIGSDKTFLYEHNSGTNPSLKSSENLNVASGKGYQINQTEVLNATTLGSNVVSSSLTSVGTLSALTVSGRVDVGGLTVDSNLTPTAGASIEAFYNSGGFIQAYDRDAPGFTSLRIKSSNYELGSDGSATFGSSTNDQLILNPGSGSLDGDASKVTVQGRTNDGTAVAFEIKRQASANSGDASTHKLKIDYAGNFGIGSDFVPAGVNGATLGAINKGAIIKGGDAAVGVRLESTAGSGGILEAFAEDGGVSFDTRGSGFIRVKSANTELFRITDDGLVGINTTTGFDTSVGLAVRNGASGSDHTMIDIIANTNETSRVVFSDDSDHNQGRIQYNHTGNSLAFYTNGNNEKLRITSDGNIGIGTDNPQEKLHIQGDVRLVDNSPRIGMHDANAANNLACTGGIELFDSAGNRGAYMGATEGSGFLSFGISPTAGAAPTEKLRITSGGNVGIGTDNPQEKLHVSGTSDFVVDTDAASLRFGSYGEHDIALVTGRNTPSGSSRLYIENGEGESLRITSGGNVGIGTDNPSDDLSILADPNSLVIGAKDSTRGNHIFQLLADDARGNGELRLYRHSASGTHEKTVEIQSSGNSYFKVGNVGIGTDNPINPLHVLTSSTDVAKFESTSAGAGVALTLDHNSASPADNDNIGKIVFNGRNDANESTTYADIKAITTDVSDGSEDCDLTFNTRGAGSFAEKLRITSGGNIGVNNTDPLYAMHFKNAMGSSPSYIHMEVTGTNTTGGGGGIAFDTSASNSDSSNSLYLATIAGVRNSDDNGSNDLVFSTTKSGVNSNLPVEKLRITSDGDVIIGTSDLESQLGSRRRLAVCDTTNGALLHLRGQSPAAFFDVSSGGIGKVFLDSADFAIQSGTPASEGTERVRITSAGNVGIGTDNPDAKLEINVGSATTALDIRGSEGQLFSVTNSLSSGSIFSVNDISGIPSIDVNADGTVQLAPYGGQVGIRTTNASSFNAGGDDLVIGNAIDGEDAGITLYSHSSDNGSIFFNDTASTALTGLIQYRHSEDALRILTAGLERFRIGSSGQIGLGGANYGTSGQVLTSNGSGSAPTWQTAAAGGGGEFSLSATDKAIHSSAAGNSSSASHSFFVGTNAGNNNITGGCNNLIGYRAGNSLTSGRDNNFFGNSTGKDTTTGEHNNFMGMTAGRYNTTGCHNNFFGYYAGKSDAFAAGTGCHNNFFGCNTGRFITTGKFNNYIGAQAGCSGSDGCCNNFIGKSAGKGATGKNNNFFGSYAGCRNSGCYNNFIGESAGKLNCAAGCNNFFGRQAGCGNITGHNNNFFGYFAGCAFCSGSYNNFFGFNAGASTTSQGNGQGTGHNNNFFGCRAGTSNTSGSCNNFFGRGAGLDNTTGCHNNFFGYFAGCKNTTGHNNNFFGYQAGCQNTTGNNNIFIGNCAGFRNTTGCSNVLIGESSGGFVSTNCNNTAVGKFSGYYLSGKNNTFLGRRSGKQLTSGCGNVSLGYYAGETSGGGYYSFQTGNYNITIGAQACSSSTTVSNEVSIFNKCKTARFQGNATAWSFVSDEREKKNIIDLPLGGDFLSKLRPRKFEWKSEDEDSHEQASGFIAQEVLEVVEEYNAHYTGLVDTNDPNQYTFAAAALIPMMVNAIQELRQELEQVKSRIDTLESS